MLLIYVHIRDTVSPLSSIDSVINLDSCLIFDSNAIRRDKRDECSVLSSFNF